jgi:hypothetical protein
MSLPAKYNDWPAVAQERYQAVKKVAASLHDYIDVTPAIALRVNSVIHKAEAVDPGDGSMFEKAANVIKKVFLTQTFLPRPTHRGNRRFH